MVLRKIIIYPFLQFTRSNFEFFLHQFRIQVKKSSQIIENKFANVSWLCNSELVIDIEPREILNKFECLVLYEDCIVTLLFYQI